MSSLKLEAVRDEVVAALDVVVLAINHIESTASDAKLRVAMLNSTIVTIVSILEEGIRELFSQYLEELEQSIATFNGLPEELRKANFDSMISLLKEGLKTSDYKSAMANIEDFYWCLSGVDKYSLFKQQIVLNQGTFKSNQLVTTSKNCGISKIWEQISSSDEIEQYTGKSGIEERATVVISEWNAFFKERDLIVHQLSKASGWRKDKILNSIKFHKMIVTQLTRVLDKSLSSYL